MKRTIVYIDGYNLYYGLIKGTKDKWLDLLSLSKALLNSEHEIVEVKYFTAPIKTFPFDAAATVRQNVYLQALSTLPNLKVFLGFYSKNPTLLPAQSERCRVCEASKDGLVRVYKLEEKRSDVNLAVEALVDAAHDRADSFVLVTGDSDQVGTVEALRKQFNRQVLVFNPHKAESRHLKLVANYYRNIQRDLPAKCHLPNFIPIGSKGRFITCPETWR